MTMLNPYTLLAGLIALLVAAGGGFYAGHRAASNACEAQKLQAVGRAISQAKQVASEDAQVSRAYEGQREQVRTVYRTITKEVNHYVDTHPDSRGCGLDADGLRIWRAANAGDAAAVSGEPDYGLSGTAAAGKRHLGRIAPEPRGGGEPLPGLQGAAGSAGGVREEP